MLLSLTAAGAIIAAVAVGIASNVRAPQGDDHPAYSSADSHHDKFVAKKWGEKPAR
jgi:hypothetical protein